MAIEIVDLPITSMVIFHSYVDIYQRVGSASRWHDVTIPHQAHHRSHWPSVAPPLLYRACAMAEPEPSKGKRWVIALECLGSSLLEQALKLAHTILPWLVLDGSIKCKSYRDYGGFYTNGFSKPKRAVCFNERTICFRSI